MMKRKRRKDFGRDFKLRARSRITNGKDLLPFVDGRSLWARLMKDTMTSLTTHCGGEDVISDTRRLFVRRTAVLEAELTFLEDKIARARFENREPDERDLDRYGKLADRQRRIAEVLGWEPTARDVTPGVKEYLRNKDDDADDAEVIDGDAA